MSGELYTSYSSGATIYAILRNSQSKVWNNTGATFETYNASHVPNYAVSMPEQGTGSGVYQGNFPTAITVADTYSVTAYAQSGGSPAQGDAAIAIGSILWDGSKEDQPSSGNLISLDYYKTFANLAITTYDTLLSTYLIPAVSQAIKTYCNRDFILTDYTEVQDGKGSVNLLLNQTPIVSISQITIGVTEANPVVVPGSSFAYNANNGNVQYKPYLANLITYPYFPCGFQNIQIVYQAGYASIPNDIQIAAALITQKLYYQRKKDFNMQSERIGDYQYANRAMALIDGDIATLLAKYRRWSI